MSGESEDLGPGSSGYLAALGLAWTVQSGSHSVLRLLGRVGLEELWTAGVASLKDWQMDRRAASRFVEVRRAFSPGQALETLAAAGLRFIPYGSLFYPSALAHLTYPPAGLFARAGEASLSVLRSSPRITIVGTRKATPYGLRAADAFTEAFARAGVVVISGLALGIDGRSHQAALSAGGPTVAVLGCGADVVYPRRHRALYEAIAGTGAILSELPPGCPPSRWTFPQRNRLLAALADAVLVVEGSVTSGAMQTAGEAAALGRPVFVVPGPIGVDNHRGCNLLLYEGAFPAIDPRWTVEDFFHLTRMERGERTKPLTAAAPGPGAAGPGALAEPAGGEKEAILRCVAAGATSVDGLVDRTGMTARCVAAALAELELAGLVTRAGPGLFIRAP
jgi:DNA processing protein